MQPRQSKCIVFKWANKTISVAKIRKKKTITISRKKISLLNLSYYNCRDLKTMNVNFCHSNWKIYSTSRSDSAVYKIVLSLALNVQLDRRLTIFWPTFFNGLSTYYRCLSVKYHYSCLPVVWTYLYFILTILFWEKTV